MHTHRFVSWFLVIVAMVVCTRLAAETAADQDVIAITALIDGLHEDAANARFDSYFGRFTDDAVFLGTDRSERWSIPVFKDYAAPIFASGRGWTYSVLERHLEGEGPVRWFDEVLSNSKLGACRGTGVVVATPDGWRIAHYSLTLLIPNDIAEAVGAQSAAADAALQTNSP